MLSINSVKKPLINFQAQIIVRAGKVTFQNIQMSNGTRSVCCLHINLRAVSAIAEPFFGLFLD